MPQLAPDLDVVDALPYVDREYEARKAEVDLLVEQEMGQMEPRDYLEALGAVHEPFAGNPRLRAEYDRVASGKPAPALDISRYSAPGPPANRQKKASEWREAVRNAEAQLEQQEVRLMNLELQNKFAANVWVRHNAEAEATKQRTELALQAYKAEITRVNQQRKEEQLAAGSSLHHLKMQWYELVAKNRLIEADCARLEQLVHEKKTREEQEGGVQKQTSQQERGQEDTVQQEATEQEAAMEVEQEKNAEEAPASSPTSAQGDNGDGDVDMKEAEDSVAVAASDSPEVSQPSARAGKAQQASSPSPSEDEVEMEEASEQRSDDALPAAEREEKEEEVRNFVKGLLVKDLKKELSQRDLSTTGRKVVLAQRLEEHLLAELN